MEEELVQKDFDCQKFISARWKPNHDVRKLRDLRVQIQTLADESAQVVKQSVCRNYAQFIKTAQEISYLESEMYQLSHFLSEQKSLIESMMELSLTGIKDKRSEQTNSSFGHSSNITAVQQLLEKLENCTHLPENHNRELLFESDVIELNFETFTTVKQLRGFLFSDGLMLSVPIPHTIGGLFRFKYDSFYPLENLALINVKDQGSSSANNLFKLLVFPEHRLLQCENSRTKKKWLDTVELAKKRMIREGSMIRQATIRMKKKEKENVANNNSQAEKPTVEDKISTKEIEYVKELPDELDSCIVSRDFDNAIDLLQQGREILQECPNASFSREILEKLDSRQQRLVEVLCKDLKVGSSTEKHVQGGPKGAKKALTLLTKLGRSSLACDLYLKNRTVLIRHGVKELKVVDNPLNYVRQLTKIIFRILIKVGKEFKSLFYNDPPCFSVYVLWASGELKGYVTLIVRHVFDSSATMFVLGQCIKLAYESVQELADIGVDLSFELDNLLEPNIIKIIQENKRNFLESLHLRVSEDKWRPYNLQSLVNVSKFLEEMKDIGLVLNNYIYDECFLYLTNQVCHFAQAMLSFSQELGALSLKNYKTLCDQTFIDVWTAQLTHFKNSESKAKPEIFKKNLEFLLNYLSPATVWYYEKSLGVQQGTFVTLYVFIEQNFANLRSKIQRINDFDNLENLGDV